MRKTSKTGFLKQQGPSKILDLEQEVKAQVKSIFGLSNWRGWGRNPRKEGGLNGNAICLVSHPLVDDRPYFPSLVDWPVHFLTDFTKLLALYYKKIISSLICVLSYTFTMLCKKLLFYESCNEITCRNKEAMIILVKFHYKCFEISKNNSSYPFHTDNNINCIMSSCL